VLRIQDPGSRVKKIPDPGSGLDFYPSRIGGVKKAPAPGSGSATQAIASYIKW
jgi:hypothetical protein